MKKTLTVISAALAMALTACDSKTTVTNLPAAAPQAAPASDTKPRDAAVKPATPAMAPKAETPKADVPAAPATAAVTVKKPTGAEKSETEIGLATTVEHARNVTKTQDSKARTRAQKAEDEMQEMMATQKSK